MYVFEGGIYVKKGISTVAGVFPAVTGTLYANGIEFPAGTSHYSSNANTFDDYEETSFTAYDNSGAGLGNLGTLYVTKFGRLVHVTGTVTYPATASGAQAIMGGLLYPSANTNWMGGSTVPFTSTGVDCGWMIPAASASIYAYDPDAAIARTNVQLSGATVYAINLLYFT